MLDFARPERKILRPHQEAAIELLRDSMRRGNRRVVIQGPVGFGKTLVASKIIEGALAKGNRVIFTAPMISLINQTVSAFEAEGIRDIGVLQASHPRTDPEAPVQIASVQTLLKRDIPKASMVIVDECHVASKVIDRLMDDRPDCFFVGLSATPWRKGMGLRWQDLVIPATTGSLIDTGFLSQFTAYAPDVPDLSDARIKAGEYVESDIERIMSEGGIVASVIRTWMEKGDGRPTLAFGVNRAHAGHMMQQFMREGIASEYVDAKTDIVKRDEIKRSFIRGDVKIICSVRTMTTGVDLPVSCIIDAAPTRSVMLHCQKIGRGLRINKGTEDLLILDHAGNSLRLGLISNIHFDKLDTTRPGEKEEKPERAEKLPKECPSCGILFTGKIGPACGHEMKVVCDVEEADGKLVEITGRVKSPTADEKQRWWSGLLQIAYEKCRKKGWASHVYREKFGVWPRLLADVRSNADMDVRNFVRSRELSYRGKRP